MPAVICVAGPAGREKTDLLHALTGEFVSRGLSLGLATVPQGAETAGAPGVEVREGGLCLSRPGRETSPPCTLDEVLARHFSDVDLVLSELVEPGRVRVELVPAGGQPATLAAPGLKALVSREPLEASVPCFAPDQARALAGHLLERALPPLPSPPEEPRTLARVLVDGRRLPLNDFVQKIVTGSIRAMIGSLKGGDRAGRLEIHLY